MTEMQKGTEEDLGRSIEDLLARKKTDIERSLAETIDQEKEKARQRVVELEKEFQKGKEAIGRFHALLEDVRTATEGVREQVGKHLEQAAHCRVMVRRLADKIGEECRNAEELRREIDDLLRKTDEETTRVRSELEGRYGLSVPFGEMKARGGLGTDQEEALERLSRFRDGLIALDGDEHPAEGASAFPEVYTGAPAPDSGPGENGGDPAAVSRILELCLKIEAVSKVGALRVFRNDGYAVLDPGSIVEEMDRFIGEARVLHERLTEAKSAKEQYFFKRDILSRQDSLRKIVQRAVEICGQESVDLPLPTNDILSVRTLMDIHERLTVGNWSDPDDLKSFEDQVTALRSALAPRLAAVDSYGKAILEQLHETF